ncbi:MAG: GDSL family lipase [Sphingobacteriales bacterium]|nr:MAG: GDSL family lipase [Sphingobacteriales bacterium]TAF79367.1 MAG: GDSL family lipase [Sphingobacteriales bacterium]
MIWYEEEVKALEIKNKQLATLPQTIFYGSSSIRLWDTLEQDFKDIRPLNLGFGGSTLAACVWFFDRLVANYKPHRMVVYAGDNDIGDGKKPEEVFMFFKQLVAQANKQLGNIPFYFISIKPSISRWELIDKIKYTNTLIENEINKLYPNWHFINIYDNMLDANGYPEKKYFDTDGLHLSTEGYKLWKKIVSNAIETCCIKI